ncbi:MAG: hypothetical protein PHS45_05305 [Bacilli bacterium]|nr:hypothetical protein [Bacilli bacterium]
MKNKLILLSCAIISVFLFTTGCELFNKTGKDNNNNNNKITNESVVVPGVQKIDYKSNILYHKFDSEVEKLGDGIGELTGDPLTEIIIPGGLVNKYYFGIEPSFHVIEMNLDYEEIGTINDWYRNELKSLGWELTDNTSYSFTGKKDKLSLEVLMETKGKTNKNKYIYFSITLGEL